MMNEQLKYRVDGQIVTNGDSLGVKGIDVPISGSLSGVGLGGQSNHYSLEQEGMRSDVVRHHVTASGLAD